MKVTLTKVLMAVGAILLIQVIAGISIYCLSGPNISKSGQFGDMFGAVNCLFSGLAFLGVIITVLLQKEELELQRGEITKSANAQEAQARAAEESARLSAISLLIQHYTVELERLGSYTHGSPKADLHLDLSNRLQALRNEANASYQILVSKRRVAG